MAHHHAALNNAFPDTPHFGILSRVWIVRFEERTRPTLVRTPRGASIPSRGRFWIEPQTGRVLMSELIIENDDVRAQVNGISRSQWLDCWCQSKCTSGTQPDATRQQSPAKLARQVPAAAGRRPRITHTSTVGAAPSHPRAVERGPGIRGDGYVPGGSDEIPKPVVVVEPIWLQRLYGLFFIELESRRVHLAGCTRNPTAPCRERNHQGLANELMDAVATGSGNFGRIRRRQRLGGLLSYYSRAA